ncbi:hypothetical protein [Sphingomicrobium flavum]|uniref:hypothetical protein n=1 Tax=Sphingomicrobium flavum TaxID=1229164 RepID=UPI0021AD6EBB|nr:hypothetical protein [Sphingomicrobium flavum]
MNETPTASVIARDARWLLQSHEPNRMLARFTEMDAATYRDASFLDDRMFVDGKPFSIASWALAQEAASLVERDDAAYLFHIGHVGSTLIARMLGELDGILSIREPQLLRDVALLGEPHRSERLPTVRRLLSRTFAPGQRALVKATSFASVLADTLPGQGSRAILLYSEPRRYIETILAGPNSPQEIRIMAPHRRQRMEAMGLAIGDPIERRGDALLAAETWACEMMTLEHAAGARADLQPIWLEFDQALKQLPEVLHRLGQALGADADEAQCQAIAAGPLISRYSKASEHAYSPELRAQHLEEVRRYEAAPIAEALSWLEAMAARSALLGSALARRG